MPVHGMLIEELPQAKETSDAEVQDQQILTCILLTSKVSTTLSFYPKAPLLHILHGDVQKEL
jgi:hypothetical protein